ncbi:Dystonin [Eumeta japonica]|uniref:Dystonin n=1 Tax=Eumeta variegata TaxID=151549 RepID=A0A4C2A724_EUMVA|nr:Dystonin [Eumeta japonica]
MTPSRDIPDRDRLPHYGPRFSPRTRIRSPRAKLLWDKWRHVWMLSWERQRRLNDHLMYLKDLERVRNFSWDDWRKRVKFDTSRMEMGAVADLFDRNGEGLIDWQEFIAALRPDWQERKPSDRFR